MNDLTSFEQCSLPVTRHTSNLLSIAKLSIYCETPYMHIQLTRNYCSLLLHMSWPTDLMCAVSHELDYRLDVCRVTQAGLPT